MKKQSKGWLSIVDENMRCRKNGQKGKCPRERSANMKKIHATKKKYYCLFNFCFLKFFAYSDVFLVFHQRKKFVYRSTIKEYIWTVDAFENVTLDTAVRVEALKSRNENRYSFQNFQFCISRIENAFLRQRKVSISFLWVCSKSSPETTFVWDQNELDDGFSRDFCSRKFSFSFSGQYRFIIRIY